MHLRFTVLKAETITTVDNPCKTVRLFKVVAPGRADGCLAAHIPDVELERFVLQRLNLEAKRRREQTLGVDLEKAEDVTDFGFGKKSVYADWAGLSGVREVG